MKQAQKTISKQADQVFRQNQKVPVATNEIELSGGATPKSYREGYKPKSQSDRAVKFDQRWRDGRAEIKRVDQKIKAEVDRIKELRRARDWVKRDLSKQVNQVLNDPNGLKALKGGGKRHVQHAKDRLAAQRTAARAARLARFKRFIRF